LGETYGDFIAARIDPSLAPFIQAGLDDDDTEFKQIEVFRLPESDGQATVRFRFANAGSNSWYWSLDNFGLYAIADGPSVIQESPSHIKASPMAQAANPDRLLALATERLEKEKVSPRDALEARLLAQRAGELLPGNPQALAIHVLALGHTGAVAEAIATIDRATALRPDFAPFRRTQALIYGMQGEQLLAEEKKAEATLCLEIADTLLRSLEATPDKAALDRFGKSLATVGRILEPRVILPQGSYWKFLDDGSDQGDAWRTPDFDDSLWLGGPARLGYGDPARTAIGSGPGPDKCATTYFRTSFELPDVGGLSELRIRLQRDDGAVVYLNGEEIARSAMPAGAIRFDTFASETISDADETKFFEFSVPATALRSGRNVVAAEVHQVSATSSDLGFDLELTVGGIDPSTYPPAGTLAELEKTHRIPDEIRGLLYARRAELFFTSGNRTRGNDCLERALAIDPDDPNVPYVRAKIAAQAKDDDASYAAYGQALEQTLALRTSPEPKRALLMGGLKSISRVTGDSAVNLAKLAARWSENGGEPWELALLERRLREQAPEDMEVMRERATILIALGRHEETLSLIEAIEKAVGEVWKETPEGFLKHRPLLQQKETCLRALARTEEADVAEQALLYPPRPAKFDDKRIDLSRHYNGSLYKGILTSGGNLAQLPDTFVPLKGVGFDLRGIIHLESGTLSDGQSVNQKTNGTFPLEATGIPIEMTASSIHFLTSCQWGQDTRGTEVARFVMHYADKSTETLPVKFLDDVADWYTNGNYSPVDPQQVGWRGTNDDGASIVLSELVWTNPHPDKTITTIDFISAKAKAAPFLVAITLE
jgi:tetratricopeptide (TPR) repeat protein